MRAHRGVQLSDLLAAEVPSSAFGPSAHNPALLGAAWRCLALPRAMSRPFRFWTSPGVDAISQLPVAEDQED